MDLNLVIWPIDPLDLVLKVSRKTTILPSSRSHCMARVNIFGDGLGFYDVID